MYRIQLRSRTAMAAAVLSTVLLSSALAQTTTRTFHLTTAPNQQAVNELGMLIRTIDVKSVTWNEAPTITVTGTPDEIALATWLIQQLDTTNRPTGIPSYTVANGNPADTVHIYFVTNFPLQAELNEFVTTLRTVADLRRIYTYTASHAIVVRAALGNVQAGDWLVQKMDVAPNSHPTNAQYKWTLNACSGGTVEVAFMPREISQMNLNAIVTTVRAIADVQPIFTHSGAPQAIAFRGCQDQVQLADWIIQRVEVQTNPQMKGQKQEYIVAGSTDPVTRVYYLGASSAQQMNQLATAIRSQAQINHIFVVADASALTLRGTPDKMDVADRIIQQQ